MVKIVHCSDTHLREFEAEPGDILVHSGDALSYGTFEELLKFRAQLVKIKDKYKHIVFVAGNHDWIFDENFYLAEQTLKESIPNIHVLHNQAIVLEGLKFWGSSDQPEFCSWAFNKSKEELKKSYANIPDDTQVLITHCPARGYLDYVINRFHPEGYYCGSSELLHELPRLKKLKAHLFGHIHYSYGVRCFDGIIRSNAAICNERYDSVNKPNIIEID